MAKSAFDVGAFDFNIGRSGYGRQDIEFAQGAGASQFQLRQLLQRARKENIRGFDGRPGWDNKHTRWLQEGRYGHVPRQSEVGFNFHNYRIPNEGWGFGKADLDEVLSGFGGSRDSSDAAFNRVNELRDWANKNRIGVGKQVDEWVDWATEDRADKAEIVEQQRTLDEWIAKAQDDVPDLAKDPPKPSFPGAGGHFVPGTTRLAGHKTPQKGRRSSIKSRFSRTGEGFQSALSIGGSQGGGTAGSKSTLNLT